LLALALTAALAWAESVDPATVRVLKKQYAELTRENQALVAQHKALLTKQSEVAAEIEKLQESGPGLLGRLKLERLLAANLDLSNQLTDLATRLTANEKSRNTAREAIFQAYNAELEDVVREMRQTRDRQAALALAHRFYALREARDPWRSPLSLESDFLGRVVEVSGADGPDELLVKAELLTDLAAKVRATIRELEKELTRLRRELKLSAEMSNMVKEMNLFEEGSRFSRRAEGQTKPTETQPSGPTSDVGRGLLPDEEQKPAPGADRAARSLQQEIKQLEDEIGALTQLARQLSARADELRKRAVELRRRDAGDK
jgi:prefoldin subunit 5